jgi:hypothetical protein
LTEKETKGIRCPFCGAPYKKPVPPNALQLKCDYCGATFHTPPKLGVEIPRCYNHCERYATGICNDCGQSFCSECLTAFPLVTDGARAMLYLCPNCLRKRNLERADVNILISILFLVVGILVFGYGVAFGSLFWLAGAFLTIVSGATIWYFEGQRSEIPPEMIPETMPEASVTAEEKEAKSDEAEAEEAERLYDQLFTKYIEHWGIQTGTQLLEGEIQAYTRHGDSYAQAMRKIVERNKMKTP